MRCSTAMPIRRKLKTLPVPFCKRIRISTLFSRRMKPPLWGAATPVESALKSGHKVLLVGVDSGKAQQQYIRDGVISGSVSQNPYQIGYKTIENAVKSLNGEKIDKAHRIARGLLPGTTQITLTMMMYSRLCMSKARR